ncbi:putative MIF4G-like, type 3, initiation factor eIF-4 gamma, MA3, MIF4G-like domain superfamily [Plasmopara halstedii]
MDERPSAGYRRGGGQRSALRRKVGGGRSAYRPVQTPESELADGLSKNALRDDKSIHRSVQVLDDATDDAPPPAPLQSSLRASLSKSLKQSASNIKTEKNLQVKSEGQRQINLASLSSPQMGKGKPKKFVSSLAQSIKQDHELRSKQEKSEVTGRAAQSPSFDRSVGRVPSRRSNSREQVQHVNSRKHPHRSHSRESGQQFSKDQRSYRSGHRSMSNSRLTRKNSTDSVSSQRSDCSDRSSRSERYNKESWSNLYDGTQPPHTLSDGLSSPKPTSAGSTIKSMSDVYILKEYHVPATTGRSLSRQQQDTWQRSSLNAGANCLRRINSSASVRSLGASSLQAACRADSADIKLHPSGFEGLPEDASVTDSIMTKSEQFCVNESEKISSEKTHLLPVVDETVRKRLKDTLRERLEARSLERGGSLANIKKSINRMSPVVGESQQHSPLNEKDKNMREKSSEERDTDKDARTRDYYAILDKENAEQEATRRGAPFKSSLISSIEYNAAPLQSSLAASIDATLPRKIDSSIAFRSVRTLKSSLAAAVAPSRSATVRAKKLQYSISELRRLMAFAIARPADLIDMKIDEVIRLRNPSSGIKRSFKRLGAGKNIERVRSTVNNTRKGDRLDNRTVSGQGIVRNGRRDKQGGRGGRSGGRCGRGAGGRGNFGRPSPVSMYDGPIEPLAVSENRWKPGKEKEASPYEKTLSNVKCLLNKLTREKFAKLASELCAVDINSFVLLSSIVSVIMDKALEEPNFADVYADLCKEFHARTVKKTWSFLSVFSDENGSYYWTGIDIATFAVFVGPFDSPHSCLEDFDACESAASTTITCEDIGFIKFRRHRDFLIAVGEKEPGAYYYSKRKISEIGVDEPFGGPFGSVELAHHASGAQTTFTRLLVNRCQGEFEKTNKHIGSQDWAMEDEEADPHRREILAIRAKAKMLGNIRFIGELYKVDLVKQSGVQGCILYLLGLELICGKDGQEARAQTARFPDEQDLEALCKMLSTVGKKFDQPNTRTIMKIIILRMVELSNDKKLPSRARFLIRDILETRDHMWEPRRKEMQQKTLGEIRKEAQKLQEQGKNAQHDDLQRYRQKTRVSSVQLAKQSTNLIVTKTEELKLEESPSFLAQMPIRIKSIIHEYLSIVDLNEAIACVQEIPVQPFHIELAEQVINTALEGKTYEREHAVELLVGLYERGALDANSIQTALVNVMQFLEDMKIDLPLIHQYSALILGRLVVTGCFGLSWVISEVLCHCVDCHLASLVFPEVLSVLESETDDRTVIRMLTDDEISPESVLPDAMRNEVSVKTYLHENGIQFYFTDEEQELDEESTGKLRGILEEYLFAKDINEVLLCIDELETVPDRWRHFVHIVLMIGIEVKQSVRKNLTELLVILSTNETIKPEDIETAAEIILDDYEDLRVDIPQIAVNLSELWTPLFAKEMLSIQWLNEACCHLIESGRLADILHALLSTFESLDGLEALANWWKKQADGDAILEQMLATENGKPKDERLIKWKSVLQ